MSCSRAERACARRAGDVGRDCDGARLVSTSRCRLSPCCVTERATALEFLRRGGRRHSSQLGAITMLAAGATWNPERVDQLKRCFEAGLTCSEIAREIGVTRNAVIGKLSRLGLSRPRDVLEKPLRRAAALAGPKGPRPRRSLRMRADIFTQRKLLNNAFAAAEPRACDEPIVPIDNGRGCTLLELGERKCRWPISDPGRDDFCFCGNEPVAGLPYCLGHARMAYRRAGARS